MDETEDGDEMFEYEGVGVKRLEMCLVYVVRAFVLEINEHG